MCEDLQVVFDMLDFNCDEEGNNTLFQQFKIKMSHFQEESIPFSMEFKQVGLIRPDIDEDPLTNPSDVKISHSHHCICVADALNREIKLFDLTSLKLIAKLFVQEQICSLFIEENYDNHHNDAIYFGEAQTFKYRIKDLLNMNTHADYLWKIESNQTYGMAMRIIGNKKELFRFNSNESVMDVINPENGIIIRQVKFTELELVICLLFITETRLIISDISNNCYIYDEVNENEWKLSKTVNQYCGDHFDQPLGLTIDRKGEKIFLSDYSNARIVVMNLEGDPFFMSEYCDVRLNPFGIDFDKRTGLLYIADQQYNAIRIVK